jgi:2'-5' RNA ligase
MDRIAVDVVLLPDERMTNRAIEANARLARKEDRAIVLSRDGCLPHVSLAMGGIERARVESIHEVLQAAARDHRLGALAVTGIATTLNAGGQQVSSFLLAQTPELQSLHEDVTDRMQSYFSYDVTAEMFYGAEPIAESSLAWVRTFREKSSFAAFFPHITIGYGPVHQPMTFPMHVTASRLALCHLGNHCTCRSILTDVTL